LNIIESGLGPLFLRGKSLSHGRLKAPVAAFGDPSKTVFRRNTLPDDQLDLLRSVLARAYEKRERLPFRLLQALRDYIGPRTKKPIIKSLNIVERKTDTA
jgi:hypothetical protein